MGFQEHFLLEHGHVLTKRRQGIVQLVGTEKEEDRRTTWNIKYLLTEVEGKQPVKYTHCELDMSFFLGLSRGIIPFANHDHAKRVLYQA